jgi:hypothetical protein
MAPDCECTYSFIVMDLHHLLLAGLPGALRSSPRERTSSEAFGMSQTCLKALKLSRRFTSSARLIATVAPVQTAHQPQPPDRAAATDQATHPCPYCGGRMNIIETFNRGSTPQYRPPSPTVIRIDTS